MRCVESDNTAAMHLILERGGISVNEVDLNGHTALSISAFVGSYQACKYLIERGASIDVGDAGGQYASHWASKGGHSDICQLLYGHGASFSLRDKDNRTPADVANTSPMRSDVAPHGHDKPRKARPDPALEWMLPALEKEEYSRRILDVYADPSVLDNIKMSWNSANSDRHEWLTDYISNSMIEWAQLFLPLLPFFYVMSWLTLWTALGMCLIERVSYRGGMSYRERIIYSCDSRMHGVVKSAHDELKIILPHWLLDWFILCYLSCLFNKNLPTYVMNI